MCRVGQACNAEEAAEERALFEQVASGNADMEYSTCRYVTVTAMYTRLLEDRVAKLTDRVAALEVAALPLRFVQVGGDSRSAVRYGRP